MTNGARSHPVATIDVNTERLSRPDVMLDITTPVIQRSAWLDDHIVTDERGETSVGGFYAAGDLVHGKKKQVYTSWDMAVDAVDAIDARIRRLKREGRY